MMKVTMTVRPDGKASQKAFVFEGAPARPIGIEDLGRLLDVQRTIFDLLGLSVTFDLADEEPPARG